MPKSVTRFYGEVSSAVQDAGSGFDEGFATPFHNANVVDNAVLKDSGGTHLYKDVMASPHRGLWIGLIGVGTAISLGVGLYVGAYRRLRDREKTSHFFYFKRLLESEKRAEIIELMGVGEGLSGLLEAAAHFYSPDISGFVRWKRRVFCFNKKDKENLKNLECFLKEKNNKKEALAALHQTIINKVVTFLNVSGDLRFECKPGSYLVGLQRDCAEKVFSANKDILNKMPVAAAPGFFNKLGEAISYFGFTYWIASFIFYFIPGMAIAGVAWPAVLIAGVFFLFLSGKAVTNKFRNTTDENIQAQQQELFENRLIECSKHQAFIKRNGIPLVKFKDSQLKKDLEKVQKKRRFSQIHAALDGFVGGCFFWFFMSWVCVDTIKLTLALLAGVTLLSPPVLIAIAVVTLVAGILYGSYQAYKKVQENNAKCEALSAKFKQLEEVNVEVPDLSLTAYDRLLRRSSLESPFWTSVKKFLTRGWVFLKGAGTGSLVLRLVVLGSITGIVAGFVVGAPILIGCMFVIAVAAGVWSCYAYDINSKTGRAENVLQALSDAQMINNDRSAPVAHVMTLQDSAFNALQQNRETNQLHPSRGETRLPDERVEDVEKGISVVIRDTTDSAAQIMRSNVLKNAFDTHDATVYRPVSDSSVAAPVSLSVKSERTAVLPRLSELGRSTLFIRPEVLIRGQQEGPPVGHERALDVCSPELIKFIP